METKDMLEWTPCLREKKKTHDGGNVPNQNVTQWGQSFVYDGFGNLLQKNVTKGSVPTLQVTVDSGNHVISTGVTYDAAGNITQMNLSGTPQPLNWDADSRLVGALSGGPNGSDRYLYGYDENNQRVWQRNWLSDTFFFYGIDGRRMGGYSLQGSNTLLTMATQATPEIYFLGRLVGQNQDQVGSVSGGGGTPYGEGYTNGSDFYAATGFATYTSDATGLDYAMNRYYSSTLGRFLSADPYLANNGGPGDPSDPQSWNRYAYALNDPVNGNDPLGLTACILAFRPDLDDENYEGKWLFCFTGGGGGGGITGGGGGGPGKAHTPGSNTGPLGYDDALAALRNASSDCLHDLRAQSNKQAVDKLVKSTISYQWGPSPAVDPDTGKVVNGAVPADSNEGDDSINIYLNFGWYGPTSVLVTNSDTGQPYFENYILDLGSSIGDPDLTVAQYHELIILHEIGHNLTVPQEPKGDCGCPLG